MSHSLSISIKSQLQLWSRTSWPRIPGDGAACVWDTVDLIAERSQDIVGIHVVERFCLASHTLPAKAGHIVSLYVTGQGYISLFPRGTELRERWIVYSSSLWWMLRAWQQPFVLFPNSAFYVLFLSFFAMPRMACGILVPWPGVKPLPPAVEAQNFNL